MKHKKLLPPLSLFVVLTLNANVSLAENCFSITSLSPNISKWWVSGSFTLTNTCSTTQNVNGTKLLLGANQALKANNFSLNNLSYPSWAPTTASAVPLSDKNNVIQITLTTNAVLPAKSQAIGSFGYNPEGVALSDLSLSSQGATAAPPDEPPPPDNSNTTPPPASQVTSGTLYFHAYMPQTSSSGFSDSMVLTGDRYTDLIMSNYIAGVLLGHMIKESFPGMQFHKDYMYGSIFAQLLQENLQTQLYDPNSNLIAPSPLQVSVMGSGQGGPYQINSYAQDMVKGSYAAGGYSLVNYVAVQKNIGFALNDQAAQSSLQTPEQFNNKYYGPALTAYFHINDLRALEALENNSQGYIASAAPNYPACINRLVSIPNNPLEIIMNYAYNQGFFGGLVGSSTTDCVNQTASTFLAKYNNVANATGSSYTQYPYQVRFYLDEIYNKSTLVPATNNHIAFKMTALADVFSKVFQTLAYVNSAGEYVYISATAANTAFNSALTQASVSSSAILDLSDATQRDLIFKILENAIENLANNLNIKFNATTLTQIGASVNTPTNPTCPTNPPVYPSGRGSYKGNTIVKGSDEKLYQCISDQIAPWCNSTAETYYAPGTGIAWTSAWNVYTCPK